MMQKAATIKHEASCRGPEYAWRSHVHRQTDFQTDEVFAHARTATAPGGLGSLIAF